MNLQETWNSLDAQSEQLTSGEVRKSMEHKPEDLLRKLNKQLGMKVFFTVLFMPLYMFILVGFEQTLIRVFMGLILAFHFAALWFFIKRWKEGKATRIDEGNVKEILELYLLRIEQTIRVEELGGLILYPFAVAGGFFLGLALGGDESHLKLEDPVTLWILAGLIVIITPLSWLLSKWLNKIAFGKPMRLLKERLAQMEDE